MTTTKQSSFWPSSWATSLFSLFLAGITLAVATSLATRPKAITTNNDNIKKKNGQQPRKTIRIAFLGNSIQYFNDCPRLLERMFQADGGYDGVYQNSCLRGGASIISLFKKGNGMEEKFHTDNALLPDGSYDIGAPTVKDLLLEKDFDFAVINDHTQSPARQESREKTVETLKKDYVPLLVQSSGSSITTPIFIQTAAYRKEEIRGTSDLGDFDHYTQLLQDGYQYYRTKVDAAIQEQQKPESPQSTTRIAPVGLAYSHIYHPDKALWERLYHRDDFHPSPHGTLLQAYILFITMTEREPPTIYNTTWWNRARRMQPPSEEPLPIPTLAEAKELRQIAIQVCQSNNLIDA
ncbi:expressed unknown protein [Seminavis robusta]|uniref:SGNH/GDSL hydrolase family protein n=1 Tax=Seminavis robusta TaxID=568900 RepID=A0A9N8HHG8_9STRA|nr:expressed unknown protein [Seminavis robusta]|eukprot:Sro635_g179120.1 n/a (350) ;mRNA; r:22610-23659